MLWTTYYAESKQTKQRNSRGEQPQGNLVHEKQNYSRDGTQVNI